MEIKVIEDNNQNILDDNSTDKNISMDIWGDINKIKVEDKSDNQNYIGFILLGVFIILIIVFIIFIPEKKASNLEQV